MDLAANLTLAALAAAIEAALGYPPWLFRAIGHPVTWIGCLIALGDRRLNHADRSFAYRRAMGVLALALLLALTWSAATLFHLALARLPPPAGLALIALAASSLIAQRSLDAHVRVVSETLAAGLDAGRMAVANIVGRDVASLDETDVARAAIESLAENFSDGIVAPVFWLALGGLPGGVCYKAINTADSMTGHRTPRHAAFGFAAAKLDDVVNFVPARLSVLWISIAALFVRGTSCTEALCAVRRDARGHPSPNAGWPEAAFAGALGLRLGGPRTYAGKKVDDAWIGSGKAPCTQDIGRALVLYRCACTVHWIAVVLMAILILQA